MSSGAIPSHLLRLLPLLDSSRDCGRSHRACPCATASAMQERMNIFVTGGAGYIGSICVEQLLDRGHRVTVFDNLSEGHRAAVDKRAQFVQGDFSDRAL